MGVKRKMDFSLEPDTTQPNYGLIDHVFQRQLAMAHSPTHAGSGRDMRRIEVVS
jgi:hypothetical protein